MRARRSLTEGLSWGPFRGDVQSRASSPGQVEPVRSPTPGSPPTRRSAAARAQAGPGRTPPLPLEPSRLMLPPRSACPSACSVSGEGGLRCWDQDGGKDLTAWEHKGGFLEEVTWEGLFGGGPYWMSRSWQDRERDGCVRWGAGPGLRERGQTRRFSGS